jgi:hypothetical protein
MLFEKCSCIKYVSLYKYELLPLSYCYNLRTVYKVKRSLFFTEVYLILFSEDIFFTAHDG